MAILADHLDAFAGLMMGDGKASVDLKKMVTICYFAFALCWFLVTSTATKVKFSAVLTAASGFQMLGFMLLSVKVNGTKSVRGISSKMLEMYLLFYCSRLTSTCLKLGYVPIDKTGDYIYQSCDFVALLCVVHLLFRVHKSYVETYDAENDACSVLPIAAPCLLLAVFVHGDINKSEFFDTCWSFSTNLETLAIVPQLWMMSCQGGKVDAVTAHFVASVVAFGVLTFAFWWYNYEIVENRGPAGAGWAIIIAHGLKLVLCADFMFYYTLAFLGGTEVVLPDREMEES